MLKQDLDKIKDLVASIATANCSGPVSNRIIGEFETECDSEFDVADWQDPLKKPEPYKMILIRFNDGRIPVTMWSQHYRPSADYKGWCELTSLI